MKTNNFNIRIPEPCHENWDDMQARQSGRYCQACNTTVIDFTGKTDNEIRDILVQNQGRKMCGRLLSSQVNRPLKIRIDFRKLPRNMSTTKLFVLALFIAFGTFLFSCKDHEDKKIGEVEVNENFDHYVTMGEVIAPSYDIHTEDSLAMINNEGTNDLEEGASTSKAICDEKQSTPEETPDTTFIETKTVIMGNLKIIPSSEVNAIEPQIQVQKLETKTMCEPEVFQENPGIQGQESETRGHKVKSGSAQLTIFPNPGNSEFRVSYELKKAANVKIDLFDEKGTLVRNIVNQPMQHPGSYIIPFTISELATGIYYVQLIEEEKVLKGKLILTK